MRSASPLLLLLVGCIVLLGPIQCLARLAVSSRLPALAAVHYTQPTHTREEVSDRSADFSSDARRESTPLSEESEAPSRAPAFADDAEAEVAPPRVLLHRRISPAAPDDAFHLA